MPQLVVLGSALGLTWAAALRAYMVELAGFGSRFDWVGTFALVLLPGAIVGGLLGYAEYCRRAGGRRGWRWLAVSPVLFAIAALVPPGALVRFVTTGLGGGAVGVAAIGMLGGYAIPGRGPLAARIVCGTIGAAIGVGTMLSGTLINPDLHLATPRGAWVLVLVTGLLALLVLASAIPHRPVDHRLAPADASASE